MGTTPPACNEPVKQGKPLAVPPCVTVFAGARDDYSVPIALHERGALSCLVTDCYLPDGLNALLQSRPLLASVAEKRYRGRLPSKHVRVSLSAGFAAGLEKGLGSARFTRMKDRALGLRAAAEANRHDTGLLAYSYYAGWAFERVCRSVPFKLIFQVHPHPAAVRSLLREEIDCCPSGVESLFREHELKLDEPDYSRLCSEPLLADGCITPSTFAASTLIAAGVAPARIRVVPYGVDASVFRLPAERSFERYGPLRVIFVGSLIQRKGVSYLLESARVLGPSAVTVTLCGRGYADERLLQSNLPSNVKIKRDLSQTALIEELHNADVFVFPSIVESFGLVVLQAMAAGLPVITTVNTCGPDLIKDRRNGFVGPIRDVEFLCRSMLELHRDRAFLEALSRSALETALLHDWEVSRSRFIQAYCELMPEGMTA